MNDAALLAFAQWCRMNRSAIVFDPVVLRNVFEAYDDMTADEVRTP